MSLQEKQTKLEELTKVFNANSGRGIELADEIDRLQSEIKKEQLLALYKAIYIDAPRNLHGNNLGRLFGPSAQATRVKVLEIITGKRPRVKDAGYHKCIDALYQFLGIDTTADTVYGAEQQAATKIKAAGIVMVDINGQYEFGVIKSWHIDPRENNYFIRYQSGKGGYIRIPNAVFATGTEPGYQSYLNSL